MHIAQRYLASKKKRNLINIITRISVVGIAVITASLVILLSAFNGIELMIQKLYSDFDAAITISAANQKTLFLQSEDKDKIAQTKGVKLLSAVIEETIVVRHEDSWSNAQLIGADSSYLRITKMEEHLLDGFPALSENGVDVGIIGAGLLDKIGGYISPIMGGEHVLIYVPKRNVKTNSFANPFNSSGLKLIGRMNYNREVNASSIVAPVEFVSNLVNYSASEYTYLAIDVEQGFDKFAVRDELKKKLGDQFVVKTNDEKNALIFKTSKTERLIVLTILVFIFILASFNLVSSLTMLFFEKMADIKVLRSLGLDRKGIFNVFFFEGLLVSGKGVFCGLMVGYLVCFAQLYFGIIEMPNSYGEFFPMALKFTDFLLIFTLVSLLSIATSYLTVSILFKRNGIES